MAATTAEFHEPSDMTLARLFVESRLAGGAEAPLSEGQAHYLRHVLRRGDGAPLLLFNGRDGEWRAALELRGRKAAVARIGERTREQEPEPDLWLCFAPVKRARIDLIAEKATELGVSCLQPVLTEHTAVERVNVERLRANAVEAAEQCGILRLPELHAPERLQSVIAGWDVARTLIFCDEASRAGDPLASLGALSRGPLGVLVGPEGGFAPDERELLSRQPFVVAISLGPRVLRADTAAVAALALLNAVLGDWR